MKKLTNKIRKYIEDETPFKHIELPKHTIKMYWSKKTSEGYQCIVVLYNYLHKPRYIKTKGYGYCKEGRALAQVFDYISQAPDLNIRRHEKGFESLIDPDYHVGGNFYRVLSTTRIKEKQL